MSKTYDVAVIGAGPSGIAAAFYAAKFGAETVLVEKDSVIGGTAFKAYVNTLKGQSLSAMDGLLSGITKKAWGSVIFDHEELLDRYYDLLKTQPVSLKTGHEAISAETSGERITSLLCASPSGRAVVSAKIIIDATGTLAVESLAGTGGSGAPEYAYMTGLIGKVETVGGKCYSTEARRLLAEKTSWARENFKLDHKLSIEVAPTVRADIAQISIRYDNSEKVTGNLMRKQLNAAAVFLQEFGYGFENASLICSSKEIFYSAQGSFNAKHTLELSDIEQNKHFSDQVAALPDGDGVGERVYYIPYGSLLSNTFENLLLCGRNIGAAANAISRIDAIPTHFETGKAAGIAAAIAVKNEIELSRVSAYEITSKTEKGVSEKIEILNKVTGAEENEEPVLSEPSEKEAQSTDFPPSFGQEEKAAPESFSELNRILELLGEDFIRPDLKKHTHELDEFAEEADLEQTQAQQITQEEKTLEEFKNEIDSIFSELDGYPKIPEDDGSESDASDAAEDLIKEELSPAVAEDAPEEPSVAETEEAHTQSQKEAAGQAPEEPTDEAAATDADGMPEDKDNPADNNISDYFEEAFLYGKNDSSPSHQDDADKEKGVVVFELPDEHTPPFAKKPEPPKNTEAESEPDRPALKETEPLPESAEPGEAGKSIVTSDDVINMLYEEEDDITKAVRKTPAYYVPDKKINKDDISFLYEDDEQQAPEKSTGSGGKDKVDSMLDMIYEITNPSEQLEDLPPKERLEKDAPDKRKRPVQSDKFKSIKDFLYDTDEE